MAPSDPLGLILGCPGGSKHYKNQWFFNVFAFRIFGFPDLLWSPLGSSWVPLGALLAPLGSHLGAPRGPLGPSGGSLASSGALLGPLGALLGSSWHLLGHSGRSQGGPWRLLGGPWAALGALQTPLGAPLGPSWGHCLPRRVPMVASWPILELPDGIAELLWSQFGTFGVHCACVLEFTCWNRLSNWL